MENASKALMMAVEILIAVLVASMFAILFSTISDYSKRYEETKQTQEVQEFNTQFTNYMKVDKDGKGVSTAQDIVSAIHLANYYLNKDEFEITVFLQPTSLINTKYVNTKMQENPEFVNEFLNNYTVQGEKVYRFKGEIKEYDISGRVKKIEYKCLRIKRYIKIVIEILHGK